MKYFSVVGVFLLVGASHAFAATCDEAPFNYGTQGGANIDNFRITATSPSTGEEWREDHCTSGDLYKVGDIANPVADPYAKVGTWALSGGTITYTYTPSGALPGWNLWRKTGAGGQSQLCWDDGTNVIATGTASTIGGCGS